MNEARWSLPGSWEWARAGEIARIVGGGTPSTKDETNFAEIGIPWITPADLTGYREAYISRGARDLSEKGYRSSGAKLMPAGTVLFSSRAPIGNCVLAANEISTNQGFKNLLLQGNISSEFVRHYLLASKDYAESLSSGTTFSELSGARIAELAIPIAPLAEQRRIVAKLDRLQACTASTRADLDRIPILVAHYKRTLLALAFSGELTRKWRQVEGLPEPPTVALEELCTSITDGDHQAPPRADRGIPFITISAMNDGQIRLDKATRFVPKSYADTLKPARRPRQGDVLYSVTGSIGIPALVETSNDFVFQRHIAILKPDLNKTTGSFIGRLLGAPQIMEQARAVATGTAQLTIPLSGLRALLVPFPTSSEQNEIVRRIGTAFAWLNRVATEHARAAHLLPKLDEAILAKAFRGELVPQNPGDEPASELLARIRAVRVDVPKRARKVGPRIAVEIPTSVIESPTLAQKEQDMNKTRKDVPANHLCEVVKRSGGKIKADALWRASEMQIDEFFKLLRDDIAAKRLKESEDKASITDAR